MTEREIVNGFVKPTREETYEKIFKAIEAGKVMPLPSDINRKYPTTTCLYEYESGNRCIVGALFTQQQVDFIRAIGELESSIDSLESDIGTNNIEFVTGLCIDELVELQCAHDITADQIVSYADDTMMAEIRAELLVKVKSIKELFGRGL